MHSEQTHIAGHPVLALRQGMSGEPGFELQGAAEYAVDVYAAIVAAGPAFGLRRLGGRAAFINHLEACFPKIVTDYLPAIFDDDMADYLAEFRTAMPPFAKTFNVAGSFDSQDVRDGTGARSSWAGARPCNSMKIAQHPDRQQERWA